VSRVQPASVLLSPGVLWLIAALSFIPLLFTVQYTGEEAVYTLIPFEMHVTGALLEPTIHGEAYRRPPLINWLVLGMASIGGWDYGLFYVRALSAISSIVTSVAIFFFVSHHLRQTRENALFAAVLYITCWQVIGGYGWKGYSDALFGSLTFLTILSGWMLLESRARASLYWGFAAFFLSFCAFLTKAVTVYVFVFVFAISYVYLCRERSRIGFLRAVTPFFFSGGLGAVWYFMTPNGRMMAEGASTDILGRYLDGSINDYVYTSLAFSWEALLNFFPLSLIVFVCWVYTRTFWSGKSWGDTAGVAALLNFLPYAIAPHSHGRYLMPIYGLVAIYAIALCSHDRVAHLRRFFLRLVLLVIFIKWLFALVLFPLYTEKKRPDIDQVARAVTSISDGRRIYSLDESWIGLAVVDKINLSGSQSGFVTKRYEESSNRLLISRHPIDSAGVLVLRYREEFFVYCSGLGSAGTACPSVATLIEPT